MVSSRIFYLFIRPFRSSGILLLAVTIFSLILANSAYGASYLELLNLHLHIFPEELKLDLSVVHWINDGLMVLFFFLVGLEIKRELITGELSSPKKAALPAVAALGGMVVPALIYLYFNAGMGTEHGWGVPVATDIAFALAILSLAGPAVPVGLKVFLTALAIIDDLGAVLVIALFYTRSLQFDFLLMSIVPLIFLLVLNRMNSKKISLYILGGIILWYCILQSGVHSTVAGVLMAMFIPLTASKNEPSLLEKFESGLHTPVNYLVLPVFALANTALIINAELVSMIGGPVAMGVMAGLIIGKPLGITFFSWLAVRLHIADIPKGTDWKNITAAAMLAGIGFTMSIFISLLAFDDVTHADTAKIAVLIASTIAGLSGFVYLKLTLR